MTWEIASVVAKSVAPILGIKIQTRLTPADINKAVEQGLKAALMREEPLAPEQRLFYYSAPDAIALFLEDFFQDREVQEELHKPLQEENKIPLTSLLVEKFKQVASNYAPTQPQDSFILPWMETFVKTYTEKTSTYLQFQLTKENYFQQISHRIDHVKFAGMLVATQHGNHSLKLDQIFVMPEVEVLHPPSSQRPVESRVFHPQVALPGKQWQPLPMQTVKKTLAQYLSAVKTWQVTSAKSRNVMLLGAPGSGKTTLMNYVAVMLAQKQPEAMGLAPDLDWLPILIDIRDWVEYSDISILDYARQFAEKTLLVKSLPKGFFEHWLEDGRTLILLDGLDQVTEPAKGEQVVGKINDFIQQFPNNWVIITCENSSYHNSNFLWEFYRNEEFYPYQIQSFDDSQIEEFIQRWYYSQIQDKAEAQRLKESLSKVLYEHQQIRRLARNPLLLTIITLIHRYHFRLPLERYQLYDQAVDLLLTSWDNKPDISPDISNNQKLKYLGLNDCRRLMERLGYWMNIQESKTEKEGRIVINRDELMAWFGREIKNLKQIQLYEAKAEAKRLVNLIRDSVAAPKEHRTGILTQQGLDGYAFIHKIFQDYLCAQEINYQADNEENFEIILNHIQDYLHDSYWQDVLLLLIAQLKPKKAAKAIQEILNHDSQYESWLHRDLLFAATSLTENTQPLKIADNSLLQEILAALVTLAASDSRRVGYQIHQQVFQTLSDLNQTEIKLDLVQLLKDRANSQKDTQSQETQVKLEQNQLGQNQLWQNPTVLKTFLAGLQDNNDTVRHQVSDILTSDRLTSDRLNKLDSPDYYLTTLDNTSLPKNTQNSSLSTIARLDNTSESLVNTLLSWLKDDDATVRSEAALALGELGQVSELVVNSLLMRLNDKNSRVRYSSIWALGKLKQRGKTVVSALLTRLNDQNSRVRCLSASVLGKLDQPTQAVVSALVTSLKDQDSDLRCAAATALGQLVDTPRSKDAGILCSQTRLAQPGQSQEE
ncbi:MULTISPECIES: HEAT repeat domain-containing protein [unclassified Moorena]|uniref:NACHT domain-containing protein n=1 Tax=unclassified Moorena TaxID=2683338 RepID=UPI0014007E50|nr:MULTISPECIES: HEAT repeat domain-containing protein [unclassified Moorena]NEO12268.1 NACHT domain-containing protein [Moorena sp. SIO3E8]NEP98911.1 NACHT domain-containing protein [Moorena sp. SIO3F7]